MGWLRHEPGHSETGNKATCRFVLVYFGEWPAFLPWFLRSCSLNPGFDWLIFSECPPPEFVPGNVKFVDLAREQFEGLVAEKLGAPYRFSYGYKLCDLKPAYGDIFSEWLQPFEFWGYTDLDLVWGRLDRFFSRDLLDLNDVVTASPTLVVGHGTVLRNSELLNRLYRTCDDWTSKLASPDYEVFDEKDFGARILSEAARGSIRIHQESLQTDDCIIWWSGRPRFLILWWKGALFDLFAAREIGYFHFIQSKYKKGFYYEEHPAECQRFYIDTFGIHSMETAVDFVRFLRSAFITCVFTIPWYLKQLSKMFLSKRARLRIRSLVRR